MLKFACFSIVVTVLIRNCDAAVAKRAGPSKAAQAYNLYRQVYNPPATTPAQPKPKLAQAAFKPAQPTTVVPEYDWYPRGRPCSLFIEKNMQEAEYVIKLMIDAPDYDSFIDLCSKLSSVVNKDIFIYALNSALIYRQDTQDIIVPQMVQADYLSYISAPTIQNAKQQINSAKRAETPGPIFVDYVYENGTDYCLRYFREDILINVHHYIWHLLYRLSLALGRASERQGELFYYLHQQVLARYNCERFACGLPKVTPLDSLYAPIAESYYPNILSDLSGNLYAGRGPNLVLQDVIELDIRISEQAVYYERLLNASVFRTYRTTNGNYVPLPSINVLSSLTEANAGSRNLGYYGNFHNSGHGLIARIHNPNEIDGSFGVMGFTTTSMRDPVFYRWHTNINNIFDTYTSKNPQYTAKDLQLANFVISSVYVEGSSGINILKTFIDERYVDISSGVDFSDTRPIYVRVKHLQHENFTHNIVVENKAKQARNITIRIFLAPNTDHLNKPIPFSEQRKLSITLDIFTVLVNPGNQTIKRRDEDSSVTLPTQLSFDQLQKEDVDVGSTNNSGQIPSRCLCGWPDTHLIPTGTANGIKYTYFVMASDGADYQEPTSTYCTSASVYCGNWNASYSDKKPMGYPLDRDAASSVTNFTQFASYPNMKCQDITIKHVSG